MYNLYYDKYKQYLITITKESNRKDPLIVISEEEKNEVMKNLNAGKIVKVIEDSIVYELNIQKETEKLREFRKPLLEEVTPYLLEPYRTKRDFSVEEIEQIDNYYYELLDLINFYSDCEDKENFNVIFADEQDLSVSNGVIYYLHKPYFVY